VTGPSPRTGSDDSSPDASAPAIADPAVARLVQLSSVEAAFEVVEDWHARADSNQQAYLAQIRRRLQAAVSGQPGAYAKFFRVDQGEFRAIHQANIRLLERISDLNPSPAERDSFLSLSGANFDLAGTINNLRAHVFLQQVMSEQGTVELLPKKTPTIPCRIEDNPSFASYLAVRSAGGVATSASRDTAACNDTPRPEYDTILQAEPDFDVEYPTIAAYFKAVRDADAEILRALN
jgi:hypothetical protein